MEVSARLRALGFALARCALFRFLSNIPAQPACPARLRSGKRNGGAGRDPKTRPFMTTVDAIANAARIDRGDKAAEIDEGLNHGRPAVQDAMAKQGIMTGIAVGGCCELSTSAHHLIDKIGTEQGYLLAESNGLDIDDAIHVAKRLLKGRMHRKAGLARFSQTCFRAPLLRRSVRRKLGGTTPCTEAARRRPG